MELHFCVLCDKPGHGLPPFDGEGLSHFRVRFMIPFPHVFVHLVKVVHSPHSPLTVYGCHKMKKYKNLN